MASPLSCSSLSFSSIMSRTLSAERASGFFSFCPDITYACRALSSLSPRNLCMCLCARYHLVLNVLVHHVSSDGIGNSAFFPMVARSCSREQARLGVGGRLLAGAIGSDSRKSMAARMLLNDVPNDMEAITSMEESRISSLALKARSLEPTFRNRSEQRDQSSIISMMLSVILGTIRAR
jgi:hypothetical protein